MKKETIEEFLKRGGKVQKLKPGSAAVLGSLDKSKNLLIQKKKLIRVLQVMHLHLIIKVINQIHTMI